MCSYCRLTTAISATPKLYVVNPGLARWLLGIRAAGTLAVHPLRGALFETLIVGEFLKARYNERRPADLYFWRDNNGQESRPDFRAGRGGAAAGRDKIRTDADERLPPGRAKSRAFCRTGGAAPVADLRRRAKLRTQRRAGYGMARYARLLGRYPDEPVISVNYFYRLHSRFDASSHHRLTS